MKDIQNLLAQVSIISKKNGELLNANGGNFNMFKILGVDHYENTHSSIISELLNVKGSHGLRGAFLKAFLDNQLRNERAGFQEFACSFNINESNTYTEYTTSEGRIDILIEDRSGHAMIIENKIYANDQWEQLKRYNKFAIRSYHNKENYQIFYITLNGTEASKDSGENIDYIQISYSESLVSSKHF
jgi:hypothetical protein